MGRTARLRIEHVALWVRDLDRMAAFYTSVLGGRAGARYENPAKAFSSYFISFGDGPRLELMHRPGLGTPGSSSAGFAHVALTVGTRADVDAAVAELKRLGVPVESGPRLTGDGYYEAVILDPEGNRIELTAEREPGT